MAEGNAAVAEALASSLPVCDDDDEEGGDVISLCDLVITGIETGWTHWWTRKYNFQATGAPVDGEEWAIIEALPSAKMDPPNKHIALNQVTVRTAVQGWLEKRLNGGMKFADAQKLIDGSYTDAVIADAILQFALYGEEIYN